MCELLIDVTEIYVLWTFQCNVSLNECITLSDWL